MPALFTRRASAQARLALLSVCLVAVAVPAFAMGWVRTSWARGEGRRIEQPVPFDHRIHVAGLRIDCRFCHAGADRAPTAGLPSTQLCVTCHQPIWMQTAAMAPVRQAIETGDPIAWRRVTQLPDFVYFDHAIHVNNDVGCERCHGQVARMAVVTQAAPLTMSWCLDCHRDPPRGRRSLTNCTTCHR